MPRIIESCRVHGRTQFFQNPVTGEFECVSCLYERTPACADCGSLMYPVRGFFRNRWVCNRCAARCPHHPESKIQYLGSCNQCMDEGNRRTWVWRGIKLAEKFALAVGALYLLAKIANAALDAAWVLTHGYLPALVLAGCVLILVALMLLAKKA
jgi:hypothetical protein